MQIGKLRNKVDLQSVTTVKNAYMEPIEQWTTFDTQWAAIEALRGTQELIAQQIGANITHRVTLRYNAGLTAKCRIKFGVRIFTILSVKDFRERGHWMELMVKEAV